MDLNLIYYPKKFKIRQFCLFQFSPIIDRDHLQFRKLIRTSLFD